MVTCYQKRISGPLMDRIDIRMQVPRVDYQKLCDMRPGESSAEVRAREEAARERQRGRFTGSAIASNAIMHPAQIRKYCALHDAWQAIVGRGAISTPPSWLSRCGHNQTAPYNFRQVLNLSRTIADLTGSAVITQVHLAQALQYRPKLGLM